MLQTDKLKKGAVYTFKLTTGEEMMAKFLREEGGDYIVGHPLVLGVHQGENGPQLGFMPFAATLNPDVIKEIPINSGNVVSYFEPPKEFTDGYLQQTSGIQLASAGSV